MIEIIIPESKINKVVNWKHHFQTSPFGELERAQHLEVRLEFANWLTEQNIKGEVFQTRRYIFGVNKPNEKIVMAAFEKKSDAMLFKLTWL